MIKYNENYWRVWVSAFPSGSSSPRRSYRDKRNEDSQAGIPYQLGHLYKRPANNQWEKPHLLNVFSSLQSSGSLLVLTNEFELRRIGLYHGQ